MATIKGVFAREILDSRGVPTIDCTMWMDNGGIVATSVPTGTSIGKYEAKELRDNDINRMLGKGVLTAVNYINSYIAPQLIGKDPTNQEEIDQILLHMDGTDNKSKLGANTTLSVSQAALKAGALSQNYPLYYYIQQKYQLTPEVVIPNCIYTVINGGDHGADNLDIQEFQIVPASHMSYADSLNLAVTIYHKLEEVLVIKGAIHSVGLVGGFTPNLYSNSDVFEILVETIKATPYTFTQDLFFGIDVAASQLYRNGKYTLKDRSQPFSGKELLEYYQKIRDLYNVFYLEDPFQEDDLDQWKAVTALIGDTTKIVGDSFLVTNLKKLQQAIENKYCNTILIKPNQVGTVTETISVIQMAKKSGWQTVMSHRSGETNDDFIADFAVGAGSEYAKFGPPNRGERIAKYNRLSQIEQEINQARTKVNPPAPTQALVAQNSATAQTLSSTQTLAPDQSSAPEQSLAPAQTSTKASTVMTATSQPMVESTSASQNQSSG